MNGSMTIPLFTLFFLSLYLSTRAAIPGDPCTADVDCDMSIYLECDEEVNKCRCEGLLSSYYDPADSRCHKYVSWPCLPTHMPCPINGDCMSLVGAPYVMCACESGYSTTPNQKCSRGYAYYCSTPTDCDVDSFHSCQLQDSLYKCLCDNSTSNYDPTNQYCGLRAGQQCLDPSVTPGLVQQCHKGSTCAEDGDNSTCKCLEGTSENFLGNCRVDYGYSCDAEKPCNELQFLVCAEGHCNCSEGHSVNPVTQMCEVNYGYPCHLYEGAQPCNTAQFSLCLDSRQCGCGENGTFDLSMEMCVLRAGVSCDPWWNGSQPCDPGRWLECTENYECGCNGTAAAVLDPALGACVLQAGEKCEKGEGKQPCDGRDGLECTEDGVCGCRDGMKNEKGICGEVGGPEGMWLNISMGGYRIHLNVDGEGIRV